MKDYYGLLGLQPGASGREVRRAYRRLVRKWHPDLNPDDPAGRTKIQEVNEAYEVLGSPEKRQTYDRQRAERSMAGGRDAGLYPAHPEHPFFSYFLKMREGLRKRTEKS